MNSESCPLAWQHGAVTRLAIAFSLGNGTDIGSAVAHTRSAATLLTARILRSALLPSSDDADILGCLPAVNIQTPKAALEVVRQATIEASGSTTLACMLVIDEVQRLSEWNLLRDFIVTLGGVQLEFPRPSPTDGGIFLSCIVLGTAYGAITEIISTSAFSMRALIATACSKRQPRAYGARFWQPRVAKAPGLRACTAAVRWLAARSSVLRRRGAQLEEGPHLSSRRLFSGRPARFCACSY